MPISYLDYNVIIAKHYFIIRESIKNILRKNNDSNITEYYSAYCFCFFRICPPSLQAYLVKLVREECKILFQKQPEECGYRPQEKSKSLIIFQKITFIPVKK